VSNPSGWLVPALLVATSLGCAGGNGDRRAEDTVAADTMSTARVPSTVPADLPASGDSLADGDVRIVTTNGGIDLALIGDSITTGLSPQTLRTVRAETDTASVSGSGFGAQMERMVKGTVQGAVGTRISFPISDVREVRYDGEKLVFEWVGKPRTLFDKTRIDGKPLLASFAPEDARRFADAVNARKGKARHL
jgi:hypothetical protein